MNDTDCIREHEIEPSHDSSFLGDELPTELWLLISSYSNTDTLFTLTKVSRRLRHIAKHVVSHRPYEQFLFNFLQHVGKNAQPYNCMQVSDLRLRFMITPKDLSRSGIHYKFQHALTDLCQVLYKKYKASWTRCKSSAAKRRRIYDQVVESQNKRQADLRQALDTKGLRLRSDSAMCQTYISTGYGLHGESLSQIVDIMDEMAWLYTHTNYASCLECIKDVHRYSRVPYDIGYIVDKAKDRSVETWVCNMEKPRHVSEIQLPLRIEVRLKQLALL